MAGGEVARPAQLERDGHRARVLPKNFLESLFVERLEVLGNDEDLASALLLQSLEGLDLARDDLDGHAGGLVLRRIVHSATGRHGQAYGSCDEHGSARREPRPDALRRRPAKTVTGTEPVRSSTTALAIIFPSFCPFLI